MTDEFANLDTARQRIHQQVQDARERTAAIDLLAETVAATVATVRSPRGEVAVTSTSGGAITAVTLASAAVELAPEALSTLITATVAAAQRAAAELALGAAEQALGSGSALVEGLRSDIQSRFGSATGDDVLR
jgi:DNA-binding protein YbaB